MKSILTLAIETSCDETSAAVVRNGREVLSNVIYSQIDLHKLYGGVVPEIASRNHVEKISGIIDEALREADCSFQDLDLIATTYGPGLVGALLVGLSTAKALAFSLNKPLIPVNHIEGHVAANYIAHPDLEPPFAALIVSGGHTHLVKVVDYGHYQILGKTRDDAAGEAYDKVARAIGIGYPGGPQIDRLARLGNGTAIPFTRTYLEQDSLDFSFSGLKSAVLSYLNQMKMKGEPVVVEDVAASFQEAVVDVLTDKAVAAALASNVGTLVLAGGVAANSRLREVLDQKTKAKGIRMLYPPIELCTDNAAMIGCAGHYAYLNGHIADMTLNAVPNLTLDAPSF
ncbi:tRNA (adenosine(37)-N6)-threonylcarbamoyltransferase complex transferase subunit TsaD [Acidaminobacter sp.]|uniref:tRNA (adenosine(37)-N6)-threonylcarbamoyltransferase complex transferase subunit TsaD n=1 Tax=Acidaminobacter sp. TaxID=1872102 RepID=UPI002565EE34|nr:tRNA (adenosine(37)-N6)-threonylcarbamoyltransferase complex transferase subunit TsaD [Acidaminobacter sp.]MDK9711893.1 tRNA (adenosine(37)-N6)-threonylcarbamoyltransferase complex transferase subunit TsaD [Acidaminobacter sp.]